MLPLVRKQPCRPDSRLALPPIELLDLPFRVVLHVMYRVHRQVRLISVITDAPSSTWVMQ